MIGMSLKAARGNFFDTAKVKNAVDRATRRVLSKFGAFVRTRARTSIRNRKAASAPGQPPSSHVGTLKKGILFAFESQPRANVVIGPVLTNQSARAARANRGTVPQVLEEGGEISVEQRSRNQVKRVTKRVAARPFMRPAFEEEVKRTLPRLWKDSVR